MEERGGVGVQNWGETVQVGWEGCRGAVVQVK